MKCQEKSNSQRQKVTQRLPGARKKWEKELVYNKYRVSVGDEENSLEIYSGDGYMTL